jgi:hypothetical protein
MRVYRECGHGRTVEEVEVDDGRVRRKLFTVATVTATAKRERDSSVSPAREEGCEWRPVEARGRSR